MPSISEWKFLLKKRKFTDFILILLLLKTIIIALLFRNKKILSTLN